jgi:FdhD protein
MENSHLPVDYFQISREGVTKDQLNAAVESPVTLSVNGESWLTFQCTPTEIESLALGFLYNEGFISSLHEVVNTHLCADKTTIDIWLDHQVNKPVMWHRSTGCYNGLSTNVDDRNQLDYIFPTLTMHTKNIFELIDLFMSHQMPRKLSGGIHTSALADGISIVLQLIDIGRHNTFDKIAGRILLDDIRINSPVLITTGRISSELVYKSAIMRSQILISMRSASQSAIALADQLGITIISSANRSRYNVLSHPERVLQV